MTESKLGTGLVTDSAKKTIELKNTDYSINKFQSNLKCICNNYVIFNVIGETIQ